MKKALKIRSHNLYILNTITSLVWNTGRIRQPSVHEAPHAPNDAELMRTPNDCCLFVSVPKEILMLPLHHSDDYFELKLHFNAKGKICKSLSTSRKSKQKKILQSKWIKLSNGVTTDVSTSMLFCMIRVYIDAIVKYSTPQ